MNQTRKHLVQILRIARKQGLVVAYAPHQRYKKNVFSKRKYLHPAQLQQIISKTFSENKIGGKFVKELRPKEHEFVASEHSCSSGFAGTDLNHYLKSQKITHTIIVGLITNSCIEATARSAIDLGYHVTLVTDAVAAFSSVEHYTTLRERYPLLAHNLTTTKEILTTLENND